MCGIYGYIGKLNAYEKVLEGLKLLQYRGYDSCGIAYYGNGFQINKAIGTLDNLEKVDIETKIAFGHTRWATNGAVNINNTHPHVSFDKAFTIVHNGIIKNADSIKDSLIKQDIAFYSDTDTEVIANLLAYLPGKIDNRVKQLFNILEGSYSLIIGYKNGDIYLVKKFSPLNLLQAEDGIYISSDISSLKQGELYTMQDNDIIKISKNSISNIANHQMNFVKHENSIKAYTLGKFKHYMQKEIYETPISIENTYYYLKNQKIRKIFKHYNKFTFIGCGTAYHSCLVGERLFREKLKYEANSELASNYELNKSISRHHLHIIVSQSGETADCIKVAERIRACHGKLLLITNEPTSTIARMADYLILTKANKELAVASTKTYCCQLFVFAYICHVLKDKNYDINICQFTKILNDYMTNIKVTSLVEKLQLSDKMILIGRDIDYISLLEASLKIREIDYIYTIPMYSGELKHGTLSLIDENSNILALNTSDDIDKLEVVKNEIESRGGSVIFIDKLYKIDKSIDEYYKPIFSIIPFQLLSYEIAISKGYNPDMPKNLAKSVTVE